ncbi:DHA2 family efflux MFS transporter permease subunit [Actinomadura flavalba]|uniref:DHA2 family efflux MFS transporter permease subunit n=1 Tax=Actinomadura flavalba TaxID=1120938 RepID=UPI00039FC7EB|nr:DHA2 family efflux MFS transporter permease subunit [Actinomadura flavalba]
MSQSKELEDEASPVPDRRTGTVLALSCGTVFLAYLDTTVVNIAFAPMRASFPEASTTGLSWVITAYAILFAALLIPAGRLSDVVGRRRQLLVATTGFAVASALCALAPNLPVLIAARAAQGAFAGGMIPAALAVLLHETPPERRLRALGAWGAAGSLAAAAGPVLGSLLIDAVNWRAVFMINVPLALAIVWAAARTLGPDQRRTHRLPDLAGTALLTAGVGALVLGLTNGEHWGWTAPGTLLFTVAGPLLIAAALFRSRSHAAPAVEFDLWRSRDFRIANLVAFPTAVAMFAWLLATPLFVATVWDYSILKAGLAVTPGAFASAVAAIGIARIRRRGLQRAAVSVGMVLFTANAVWLWLALTDRPAFLPLWLATGLLGGTGIGLTLTGLNSTAALAVPPARFATGTGLHNAIRQVGGAFGVAGVAMISVAAATGTGSAAFRSIFLFTAVMSAVAALGGLALLRTAPAPAPAR